MLYLKGIFLLDVIRNVSLPRSHHRGGASWSPPRANVKLLRLSSTLKVLNMALLTTLTHEISHQHSYTVHADKHLCRVCQITTEGLAASASPGSTWADTHNTDRRRATPAVMPFQLMSAGHVTDKGLCSEKQDWIAWGKMLRVDKMVPLINKQRHTEVFILFPLIHLLPFILYRSQGTLQNTQLLWMWGQPGQSQSIHIRLIRDTVTDNHSS